MVGLSTTGEQIQDDGRVFEGDSVSSTSVVLPSFTQLEFEQVKEGLEVNGAILTGLGWQSLGTIPSTLEEMEASGSFLSSTYHYHGMMCPTTNGLAPGFHACDLSRMCRKWAGSTSVAAGAMGVQCGEEVAAELAAMEI